MASSRGDISFKGHSLAAPGSCALLFTLFGWTGEPSIAVRWVLIDLARALRAIVHHRPLSCGIFGMTIVEVP